MLISDDVNATNGTAWQFGIDESVVTFSANPQLLITVLRPINMLRKMLHWIVWRFVYGRKDSYY
jgi:hypothetical protein